MVAQAWFSSVTPPAGMTMPLVVLPVTALHACSCTQVHDAQPKHQAPETSLKASHIGIRHAERRLHQLAAPHLCHGTSASHIWRWLAHPHLWKKISTAGGVVLVCQVTCGSYRSVSGATRASACIPPGANSPPSGPCATDTARIRAASPFGCAPCTAAPLQQAPK